MLSFKLRFAWRNLKRNRLYTLLNLVGLALGLATAILVSMYLYQQFSYDKHHTHYQKIFRANSVFTFGNDNDVFGGTGLGFGSKMAQHYPQVEAFGRLFPIGQNVLFSSPDTSLPRKHVAVADADFLKVFELAFLEKANDSLLKTPRTLLVSESFANHFFGHPRVVGQTIATLNYTYTITGVFKDLPQNTHHFFEALIAYPRQKLTKEQEARSLWNVQGYTFFKLKNGLESAQAIEANFDSFYQKHMAELGKAINGTYGIRLERIDNLHFNALTQFDEAGGTLAYLYGFAGIGLLILVLASINYINMATARGLRRIREAAMRKVLGATPKDIRLLLFSEAILLSIAALFLAFVLVELLTQLFPIQAAFGNNLSLSFSHYPFLLWLPITLALLVGLFSGWYPAFSLAKVSVLDAFNNKRGLHLKNSLPRKLLVGFQVLVSVAVVIVAFNMYRQINFVQHKNLGFTADNVLLVPLQDSVSLNNIGAITKTLSQSEYIKTCVFSATQTGVNSFKGVYDFRKNDTVYEKHTVEFLLTGLNYLETMQIKLLQGRDFLGSDTVGAKMKVALVNQSLVKMMNWENPLGQKIKVEYNEKGESEQEAEVIGVVQDFNSSSLHQKVQPLALFLSENFGRVLHIRLAQKNRYAAISDIEKRWSRIAPEAPFQFSFLNQRLQEQYTEETRQSKFILYLTALAIFISFLGFVGLASFTINLRTREIGIRQVLGAGVYETINLVFKELLWVILVAVIFAIPLALLVTTFWLSNFAYTAPMQPAILVLSTFFTLLFGYGIVALHSLTLSKQKTIESLHHN